VFAFDFGYKLILAVQAHDRSDKAVCSSSMYSPAKRVYPKPGRWLRMMAKNSLGMFFPPVYSSSKKRRQSIMISTFGTGAMMDLDIKSIHCFFPPTLSDHRCKNITSL